MRRRGRRALEDAAGIDPVFMRTPDKAEALVRLTHLVDRLETLRLRVIAASDDVADHDGAPNVASWLAPRTRGDPEVPADLVRGPPPGSVVHRRT